MELTIVNAQPKYGRVGLIEPPPTGYLLLAAVVESTLGRTPFPRRICATDPVAHRPGACRAYV